MVGQAVTYRNHGRWKELQLQAHVLCQRVLGAEHPDMLPNMANLVVTYNDQGRWREAEVLQLQVRDGQLKVFSAEHPDTLRATGGLAVTYRNQGGGRKRRRCNFKRRFFVTESSDPNILIR